MTQHETWTPGAQRAIAGAQVLAGPNAAEPLHLLWALLMDESRASVRMAAAGMTRASCGVPREWHTVDLEELDATAIVDVAHSQVLQLVLNRAIDLARGETATEHLLDALLHVASPATEILRQHGLALPTHRASSASAIVEPPLATDIALPEHHIDIRDAATVARMIDASANRTREGLRVWEAYTRFSLNDRFLSEQLKQLRHELGQVLSRFPTAELLAARDTSHDVGTSITGLQEGVRESPQAVAHAAAKRTQEALRSLEEYLKVVSQGLAARVEQLRYRSYTLEKAVFRAAALRDALAGVTVYLLVTEAACHSGIGPVVKGALEAGVKLIQLREKSQSDPQVLATARHLRELTRTYDATLIINDRPDLALLCDADGVHLGQDDLSVFEARRLLGPQAIIGVSTHTIEQARQAVLDGADYLGVGPTFPSHTKAFDAFAGLAFVNQVAMEISRPWFAIGGINLGNLEQVMQAGASRIALTHEICAAEDPGTAATELLAQLAVL